MPRSDANDAIRRSLQTLEGEDPDALRRQALDAVQLAVGADAATFFKYDQREGVRRYAGLTCTTAEARAVMGPWEGREVLPNPYDHLRPQPRELNRFVDKRGFLADVALPEDHPLQRHVYGPLGVRDEQRALCFDGRRFLGRVATLFHAEARVTTAMTASLNRLMPELHALLVRADRLERAALEQDACFLVRPDGTVDHATAPGARWLNRDRRARLADLVRAADAGRPHDAMPMVDGARASLVRMHGSSVLYLVSLAATIAPELSPENLLTPRQREIANYAVAGATGREIAEALGLGHETVREHLKEVYRRLGVGSRVELVHLLRPRDG